MPSSEMYLSIYERVIAKYSQYKNDYETTGQIEYFSNKNPITSQDAKVGNVAKTIIVLWLSLIGIVPIVLIHKENISSYISSQPLIMLIVVYFSIILAVILLSRYKSKKINYLATIVLSDSSIKVCYSQKDYLAENELISIKYAIHKTVLHLKRSKRKNVDQDTSKRTPFIVLIKSDGKVDRYKMFAYDKCDLLAFVLFLESFFNKINIQEFSPTEIESMYYSSNFGLKMCYTFLDF